MTDGTQQPREPRPGGYGYPGTGGYGHPQGGYGYPPQAPQEHSTPSWTPPSEGLAGGSEPQPGQHPYGAAVPDWSALAERSEADRRRRRLLLIAGSVLGAAAVAGIVATAVIVGSRHKPQNTAHGTPVQSSAAPQPTPSFSDVTPPPPPDPLAVLSDPRKDTAPLTTARLFPGAELSMQSRRYTKGATDSTTVCSSAAAGGLGNVLAEGGCRKLLRATYRRGGVAVTVGVAVFDSKAAADRAKQRYQGYVEPLAGDGVPAFCHATACQTSANAVGRYAYFTISGLTSGAPVTAADPQAQEAGNDIAAFTFNEIVERGRNEAASTTA